MKLKRILYSIGRYAVTAAALLSLFFAGDCFEPRLRLIVKAFSAFLFGWLMLAALYRIFEHNWVKVAVFILLALFGMYIYGDRFADAEHKNDLQRIIATAHSSLFFLFPKREYNVAEFGVVQDGYYIFNVMAFFYFALVSAAIWGRRVMNQSSIFLTPEGKRNIFWSYSEGGMMLAQDIVRNSATEQFVVVLSADKQRERSCFDEIDRLYGIALYKNQDSDAYVAGRRHFFLSDDIEFNVRMAFRLLNNLKTRTLNYKVHLYVRTDSAKYYGQFAAVMKQCPKAELHIFNEADLFARSFAARYPMLDCPDISINTDSQTVSGTFNLLLLGFGVEGQELLKKSILDSQFVGSDFRTAIFDRSFEQKHGDYPALYDECVREYHLSFNPVAGASHVGGKAFYAWAEQNLHLHNRIIIALGNDSANIDAAIALARILNKRFIFDTRRRIFAFIRDSERYAFYSSDSQTLFTPFGDISAIYTKSVVINETMDSIALMVNYIYNQSAEMVEAIDQCEAERLWERASLFDKDSSRAVAQTIHNATRIAGGDIAALPRERFENLAINEHLRWNAFHYLNGVRSWALDDIPADSPNAKLTTDVLQRHGCLMPYEDLPLLSDKVNPNRAQPVDYQEADRRIVRHFPLFVSLLKKHYQKLK